MELRLQKFIADCGITSRRKAEELIKQGRIKVNGKVVLELGTKVNPEKDEIKFDDKVINIENKKVYILLNKPIGYVTTVSDQFKRDTVMDLIKNINVRVVPCGRLDMYTSGALILSNDGDFINKITHPKNEIEKTYNVTLVGKITPSDVENLKNGVEIDLTEKEYTTAQNNKINKKYKTNPAKVKILKIDEEKNLSRLQITIHEGKNREVRKMCEAIGKRVIALHRAKIGNIDVKDLKLGSWRYLKKEEIEKLMK